MKHRRILSVACLSLPLAIALAALAVLAAPLANATTITWDANGVTASQTDGAGAWLTANQWWNGSANVNWTSGDDAIFGNGGAGGAVTLASPTTVNSLTLNSFTGTYTLGTAGQTITLNNGITMNAGAGAVTIVSPLTLAAAQSWLNNSSSLLTIGTGAVTNGGNLLTVGGSANTTISSVIGGAGGLTKTGSGTLTLSGANTFGGQLSVQNGTLSIASINNVSANGTLGNSDVNVPVILGSGGQTGTLQYTGATATSTKAFALASGGIGAFDVTVGANTLTLSNVISGSGGLTKIGAGTLNITNNANQFTGNTVISAGKVTLGSAATPTPYALWKSAYDTTGSNGTTIGLSYLGTVPVAAPVIGGLAGSVDLASAFTAGYSSFTTLTLNPQAGSSVSYGGVIANGAAGMTLTKTGGGTQTLTNTNTYSGATTIYAGTLALSGASGTAQNSAFTVLAGTLLLDNTAALANRLNDATALSLGSLYLKANVGGGIQSETVGATTFAVGGKVTVDLNGGTDQTTLAMGTVTRSGGAAIDFVGVGGTLGGGANSPNVTSSSLPANTNGILDWATVGGTQWAENNSNSIRAYSGSFTAINSSTNAQNAQVSGSDTLSGARVGNSLNLIATATGQSLALGANNLTLGSAAGSAAAILKSGSDAYTISGTGQVRAGSAGAGTELIAHVDGGALTISAPLSTSIVGIAKGGTGDLILSGTRAGTMTGAIGIAGGQLEFRGASTTISGSVSGPGGITVNLNAGQTLLYNTTNMRYSGPTIVKGGILSIGSGYLQMGNFSGVPGASLATQGQGLLSNLELNGGSVTVGYYMSEFLGSGPGQIQLTGGTSGFSNSQGDATGNMWTINADASYEVVWGSPFFKPDALLLGAAGATHTQVFTIPNRFDLNGTTRTIATDVAAFGGALSGVIRSSSGTAGITKTGIGPLSLSGLNTFNGPVTINGGTLIANTLANGGSASSLGASTSDASNLVISSGTLRYTGGAASTNRQFTISSTGTLDASGSGAINFTNTATPAYGTVDQARTLTLAGTNTGNNTLAANIADNGTGAVSVTKTGTGLWVLSNASNSYTGPTTLTAGTLSIGVAANLGAAASNLVFNGGTLQITGTGLTSLSGLGRTIVFTSGQTVGLDINNAGNTFTADQVLSGVGVNFTKAGAGTLVLNQANTYTGGTTISAGTLQLNDGGAISSAPLSNSGTFAINRSTTTTLGTNIPASIFGTGNLTNIGSGTLVLNAPTYYTGTTKATAGTITLSHALAIQNSALDTTGAGTVTLNGVTTPTIGGLSGASGNLASVISSGYGSVTALTLNPSGSVTYGGIIADGAAGMTITKTGAGTQILSGANTYTGTTTINQGTLQIGNSVGGSLNGTTGTALTFTGTGTFNAQEAAGVSQGMGALTFSGGDATVTSTWNNGAGSGNTALTFASLSVRAAGATGNFSLAGTGSTATNNRIALTSTTNAPLTTGSNDQGIFFGGSNYARYNATTNTFAAVAYGTDTNATTVATGATIGATTAASDINITGAITAQTTAAVNTIRTGTAITQTGGSTLSVNGILTTAGVAIGTAGNNLQTNNAGGDMVFNATSGTTTVAANIIDNSNSTLTKTGAGTLTLSGTNTYAGGTFLNAGTLNTTTPNTNLGAGTVTVNGPVTWNFGTTGSNRALTINDGAALSITGTSNQTFSGALSGNGTITQTGSISINFSNANAFTGAMNIAYGLTFGSLGDSANPIILNNSGFTWTGGAKTFALRPFTLNGAGTGTISSSGTGAIVIQQNLAFSGAAGARTLTLGGTYTTTANQFAGNITDGPGSVVTLSKSAGSNWALSGANTYSGTTTIPFGGTASALTFQGIQALSPYTSLNSTTTSGGGAGFNGTYKVLDDSATPASRQGVNLNFNVGENAADAGRFFMSLFVGNNNTANGGTSSGTTTGSTIQLGNMNFNQVGSQTTGGGLAVTGANSYKLQINNVNISLNPAFAAAWPVSFNPTSAPLIVAGNVQQLAGSTGTVNLQLDGTATGNLISGNILNSADGTPRVMSLSKANTSTWTLSGSNSYTGNTTVTGGALVLSSANALPGGIGTSGGTSALTFNGGVIGLGNGDFTRSLGTAGTVTAVNFTGAGGWAAYNADRLVNLGGASATITWATANTGFNSQTLILSNATATHKVTLQNGLDLTTAARTVQVDDGTATVDAEISGVITGGVGGALTKTGAGTLRLSNTNTYVGITTINGSGALEASVLANGGSNSSIGASSNAAANLVFLNSISFGALRYVGSANVTIDRAFTTSNGAGGGAAIESSGTGTLSFSSGALAYGTTNEIRSIVLGGTNTGANTFGKTIANNTQVTNLTKNGVGTWIVNAANTYTGTTTVNAGTLQFAKMVSLNNNVDTNWTAAKINVKSAATLAMNVDSAGTNGFTDVKLNTLLGNISVANTATEGLQAGAILGFDTSTATAGTFTQGNAIANSTGASGGAIGLTKLGTGILILDKTNTYTGATTVAAGTLAVNGSLANTTTTVQTGGRLQGNGTIGGSVTIQTGGTLATGNSIESLATGTLSLDALATFAYETDKSVAANVAGDLTAVTGNLNIASTAILTLTELNTLVSGTWDNGEKLTLISYSGVWNNGLFDYAGANGGLGGALADGGTFSYAGATWQFDYNDTVAGSNYTGDLTSDGITGRFVTMTVVPEPGAAFIGSLGLLALLRRRRN